ncbi:3-hydroxyacyl-CoA dehydrogenase NAD-binding domain-containing protein [Hoeflea alexandrii]|uniref:3-hydroxyacyl-CoA dehydrogenase NAD-binding domain-containing protein n=1 Tax=Hoeflea alexandrii TaxID=288436 RepID=UPI00226DEB0B|nr:3-hydroxyacyl-CoA dehydrogenase NAD-binding domain-containing protein [Hoeflea alexandrii]MCY0151882.1 3-hydroxyacyl-CoA dehydrogenase NAD-binding domain-containing protein [Hoeflea alexandrii]
MKQAGHLVVLGAGSIGVSFSAVFRDAGFEVTICDPDTERSSAATQAIEAQRAAMALAGLERGGNGKLNVVGSLDSTVEKADMVIEAGPERLEDKQAIFLDLLERASQDAILATASSAIPMSRILPRPADQARCLVAHPVNPPAILRLIELCPAPSDISTDHGEGFASFRSCGFSVGPAGSRDRGLCAQSSSGGRAARGLPAG